MRKTPVKYVVTKDKKVIRNLKDAGIDYFTGPDGLFYFVYYEPVFATFDFSGCEYNITERVFL